LLHRAVGLQQKQWRRLCVHGRRRSICAHLASVCVCVSKPKTLGGRRNGERVSSVRSTFRYIVCRCCLARYLYWAAHDIPDNPTERINNVEFLYERQFHPNVGNAVMASSYALLCYLERDNMTHAVPIMKFITSQRNHLMGWSSTSV